MSAAILYGKHDLRIAQVAVPAPGPGEVLLEVSVVGVCGTDAAEYTHGPVMFPVHTRHPVTGHLGPMVIGHEFAGRVVGTGAGIDPAWIGREVSSCGSVFCGRCTWCRAGRSNLCASYATVGLHRNGALARYVATPLGSCQPADALGLTPDEAVLGQPMGIAVHATRRSQAGPGDTAVVWGVGGVGAFLVYTLVRRGVRVVAVDLSAERLAVATALGATAAVRPEGGAEPVVAAAGAPPPLAFEVTGAGAALSAALSVLGPGGRLIAVGIHGRPRELDLRRVTLQEQEIIGTNALCAETDLGEALTLIRQRPEGWRDLAPVALPLARLVPDALEPMAAGRPPAIKTLIDPTSSAVRPTRGSGT